MRHILGVIVRDQPGVLSRVAGLFTRRGFNIESLAVGTSEEPGLSRITLVIDGDDRIIEQVDKQLQKLIDVIRVTDLGPDESVCRELCLIKVNAEPKTRSRITDVVEIFRGQVVDVGSKSMIIEITGGHQKVEALLDLLREFGIKEVARTGVVSLGRGQITAMNRKDGGEENDENLLRWRRGSRIYS